MTTLTRPEIAALVLLAPLAYASADGLGQLGPIGPVVLLGALAGVLPLVGLLRPDLRLVAAVPGFFLFLVLFTVSGIATNDLPGPLGELIGGWAAASPLYIGILALSARDSPGVRALLAVVALLAAVAVVAVAQAGPFDAPAAFANAFVRVPRLQAEALVVILTGGVPSTIPLDPGVPGAFVALLLLGGAGALAGLLSVDPDRPLDAVGFENPEAPVPEGTYRSLFPEGRDRLREASPDERPAAPELPSLGSLLAAVIAGLTVLAMASSLPNLLLPAVAVIVVLTLLVVALGSYRSRPERTTRPSKTPVPAPADPGPARPTVPRAAR